MSTIAEREQSATHLTALERVQRERNYLLEQIESILPSEQDFASGEVDVRFQMLRIAAANVRNGKVCSMAQTRKKKRHTKTEFVLVRMELELKKGLDREAVRRALDVSALARTLIAEGLELEAHIHEMRRKWKSRKKGERNV